MNKSETEKAALEAYSIFKSSLEATLGVKDLIVSVDVVGVKLSTLAVIVEENENLEIITTEKAGIFSDETRNTVYLYGISLEHSKKN